MVWRWLHLSCALNRSHVCCIDKDLFDEAFAPWMHWMLTDHWASLGTAWHGRHKIAAVADRIIVLMIYVFIIRMLYKVRVSLQTVAAQRLPVSTCFNVFNDVKNDVKNHILIWLLLTGTMEFYDFPYTSIGNVIIPTDPSYVSIIFGTVIFGAASGVPSVADPLVGDDLRRRPLLLWRHAAASTFFFHKQIQLRLDWMKIGWRLNIENFFMKFTDSMLFKVCLSLSGIPCPQLPYLHSPRVVHVSRKKPRITQVCTLLPSPLLKPSATLVVNFWLMCAPPVAPVAPGNGEWLDFSGPSVETGQIYSCCMLWQELSLCWEQAGLKQSKNCVLSLRNSVNTWKILEVLMIFPPAKTPSLYSVADEIFPPRYQLSLQALLVKAVRILGVLGSAVSFPSLME